MIEIQHLYKTFETKDGKVEALKDINRADIALAALSQDEPSDLYEF